MNSTSRSLIVIASIAILSSFALAYSGGDGSPVNPYQIASVDDFMQLSNTPADWNKAFILTADIDLSSRVFNQAPIAPNSSPGFVGIFDGSGRTISNLVITAPTKDYVGLFGSVGQIGQIKNLGIKNANIQGRSYVGGLAGYANYGQITSCFVAGAVSGESSSVGGLVGSNNYGIITSCHTTGAIMGSTGVGGLIGDNLSGYQIYNCYSSSTVSGMDYIGGLIGRNRANPAGISYCYATGIVSGNGTVGGLIGFNENGTITSCYSTGSIVGGAGIDIGGLIGRNMGSILSSYAAGLILTKGPRTGGLTGSNTGSITNCYSVCPISALMGGEVGGLIGNNTGTVTNCYAAGIVQTRGSFPGVGGLIGSGNPASIKSCFWDIEATGRATSAGGAGKTTVEMQTLSTFSTAGWDFNSIEIDGDAADWALPSDKADYPKLIWQELPTYSGGDGTAQNPYQIATVEDFKALSGMPIHWSCHFILTSDIDLSGISFTAAPIAPYTTLNSREFQGMPFMGVFDGNGHHICNLTIPAPTKDYIGLFGCISGGLVKNLGLNNVKIEGRNYVGSLAGVNSGMIVNCFSDGDIKGYGTVGGLIGFAGYSYFRYQPASLLSCDVINCYSTCSVKGNYTVGGLVGAGDYCKIAFCYSTGAVSGQSVGGLLSSYGRNCAVASSFWDIEASGCAASASGVGKMTAEMMKRSTFTGAGWDFVGETANGTGDIWAICEGKDYPRFAMGNTTPMANAGQDQTVYAWYDGKASVTLNGADSNDADGDALTYSWMLDGQVIATECNSIVTLPVGVHTLSLMVSDGIAESAADEVVITVVAAQQGRLMVVPAVINRKSQMPHIMAMFQLPEGVNTLDGKVALYPGGLECKMQRFLQINRRTTVFAWFDKDDLMQAIPKNGITELTLVGKQPDGPYLYGKDRVLIFK